MPMSQMAILVQKADNGFKAVVMLQEVACVICHLTLTATTNAVQDSHEVQCAAEETSFWLCGQQLKYLLQEN